MNIVQGLINRNRVPDIVKIGIWGPPKAGKTSYLAAMKYSKDKGNWRMRAIGPEAEKLIDIGDNSLFNAKNYHFPPQTIREFPKYITLIFESPEDNRKRVYSVSIPEVSGEIFAFPEDHELEAQDLVNSLSQTQGLIWLIDPDSITDRFESSMRKETSISYKAIMEKWLSKLSAINGNNKLPMYIAFCLTKMDKPKHSENFKNPRKYILTLLAEFSSVVRDYCDEDRVEFFSTTAIGFNPLDPHQSNQNPDDPGKILHMPQPKNLFLPFEWLFNKI